MDHRILKKDEALKGVKLFILDMDGTVYLGSIPIDGAFDFIHRVEQDPERDYLFFTNNASAVPSVYVKRLVGMGLEVTEDRIVTAGDVSAEYILAHHPGARVYLNGTRYLEEDWRKRGIDLVDDDPDIAVQSFDKEMSYEKIDRICRFIRNGVPFYATHMDLNCPTETGYIPDCGSMCAMITASTGKKPRYFGKPWPETIEMITRITGVEASGIAFVGDRLYTDVATGVKNGARGFLVLTGESDMQTVEESDVKPTCIYDSLKEMIQYL